MTRRTRKRSSEITGVVMVAVHHRHAQVRGRRLFYREAGPADLPAVVLLHGFPTSSFMFRGLVPALADGYHVIAPDHLGFGLSDAPPADEFAYTFDALTDLTAALLDHLGVARYAIYVQDYGAPIGWRLAPNDPAAIREALTLDAIKWQYLTGVPDPSLVSPDTWHRRRGGPGERLPARRCACRPRRRFGGATTHPKRARTGRVMRGMRTIAPPRSSARRRGTRIARQGGRYRRSRQSPR
ncbi:alpha/beta fold hydrolase [Nonomuraea rubra]|uniref:alpha/beta fold hydrolase n=1 Tax=Nonomuraea rubra TaxID=46180 RepID=UPI003408A600